MIVRTSLVDLRKVIPITIMYQLSILIVRIFLNFYIDNSSTVNIKHQKVRKKEDKKRRKRKMDPEEAHSIKLEIFLQTNSS